MNPPILSIIIATKNREEFCIQAIKSIMQVSTDLIQIAISDNSKSNKIGKYIDDNPNENIIYAYDKAEISSIENFNRAMGLSTGEYIFMIGDDDTILPELLKATQWAKNNNVDSLSSNNIFNYYWPEARTNYPKGLLIVPKLKLKIIEINPLNELKTLIKHGIINYYNYNLPKTYHGLVKRDLMEKIKTITGNYYGGLSPDIYSVFAVSILTKNHYSISIPLSIAGVCQSSSSAENLVGKHSGILENMPHLRNNHNYIWDKNIPEYYSVSTVWAESAMKALSDLEEISLYQSFNMYPLLAQGILMNRNYILSLTLSKTKKIQKNHNINPILFWMRIIYCMLILIIKKIGNLLYTKLLLKKIYIVNVKNIASAQLHVANLKEFKNGQSLFKT